MYGFGWLITALEFCTRFLHRERGDSEPLIDGYGNLTGGQQHFIKTLERRLDQLEKSNERLNERLERSEKDVEDCNSDRTELKKRVEVLEAKAVKEKNYTHDRVHEFENFMDFLELDLKSANIEVTAITAILQRLRDRRDAQYPREYPSI